MKMKYEIEKFDFQKAATNKQWFLWLSLEVNYLQCYKFTCKAQVISFAAVRFEPKISPQSIFELLEKVSTLCTRRLLLFANPRDLSFLSTKLNLRKGAAQTSYWPIQRNYHILFWLSCEILLNINHIDILSINF